MFGRIDAVINAIGAELRDAASDVNRGRREVQEAFEKAKRDLENAKADVQKASLAFDKARKEVGGRAAAQFASTRCGANRSYACSWARRSRVQPHANTAHTPASRPQADEKFDRAQRDVANARAAFEKARRDADAGLAKAIQDYNKADQAFNVARDHAMRELQNARNSVTRAQAK